MVTDTESNPSRRVRWLFLACLALGLGTTIIVAVRHRANIDIAFLYLFVEPRTVFLLGGATLANLAIRFVRWQYFLRCLGIRRSTRDSLQIHLASVGLSFVPLYAGEIALKGFLVGAGDRREERLAWTAALYERLCDLVTLSSLASLALMSHARPSLIGNVWWLFVIPLAVFASRRGRLAAVNAARVAVGLIDRWIRGGVAPQDDPIRTVGLASRGPTVVGMGFSLAAWSIVCAGVALALRGIVREDVWWETGPLFAATTVLGSLSLAPGGAGVTGSAFAYELVELGVTNARAIASVIVVRAFTFWLALAIGQLVLARMAIRRSQTQAHFDEVAPVYDVQFPQHMRDLVVSRKVSRMLDVLGTIDGLRGLDMGCGTGWYLHAFDTKGATVVGIDLSPMQARTARAGSRLVLAADAVALPFRGATFDFAYAVNIVHHLGDHNRQFRAFTEAARILKPGGMFFLHEINVTNPIFRFYMGYIFPLIKRIDEGTEIWLKPESLPQLQEFQFEGVQFFTFLPDFVPRAFVRFFLPIEARLEASSWARYSAHFMATFRKMS